MKMICSVLEISSSDYYEYSRRKQKIDPERVALKADCMSYSEKAAALPVADRSRQNLMTRA